MRIFGASVLALSSIAPHRSSLILYARGFSSHTVPDGGRSTLSRIPPSHSLLNPPGAGVTVGKL